MPAITLAEAKAHLNITGTTYDAELADFITTAEAVIAQRCGPLSLVAVSRRVAASGAVLVLPSMPVVSLTSLTPVGGTAVLVTDLFVDVATGVVRFNSGASFGGGLYDVVFQSGRVVVPADLAHAVKDLVKHLWADSQRGGSGARRPGSDAPPTSAAYLLPYKVQSSIEPHLLAPGVH